METENKIYNLEIAKDIRKAKYYNDTDIEIIEPLNTSIDIQKVILDHDGTISTLREGWEKVMLPVMINSICGSKINELSTKEFNELSERCSQFIDETTGIQTIVQMQGLVEMIKKEGYIEKENIKTAAEYKAIYLDELMVSVNDRIKRFQKGERGVSEYTMLGSVKLLNLLKEKGLTLFLASGTDEENVVEEATVLGYSGMFNGGIFGSKGNEIGDAKKIVIERIIKESGSKGENLMVIGDGPVELREGRKVGALCIGVASDEIRRYGLNESKRERLIKAGAHIVIPDFSQLNQLREIIFNN
jgi:phosphoglycolate phosphatase-like HAD superfamily hydrolase